MREIKFRGQRQSDNKWIYGDLLQPTEICDIYEISDCESIDGSRYDVVEDTIGQYTGLKDKNGKEVYLGDILEYTFTDYKGKKLWKERYIIKENISGWEMRNITKPRGHRSLSLIKNYKIIGNIYENPELLEDK